VTGENRQGFILGSRIDYLQKRLLNQLKAFTCDGVAASSLHDCINDGQLCSGKGLCTDNACVCDSDREGQYCESLVSEASSDSTTTIIMGSYTTTYPPTPQLTQEATQLTPKCLHVQRL
jgi:hypothetical protein